MAFVSSAVVTKSAFHGASLSKRVPVSAATVTMGMSKSVPFLPSPAGLDSSAPGFADFDPMGFSSAYDLKFLQEAEIKHGRICMLATLGWIIPEFYHLPDAVFSKTNPLAALGSVPKLGLVQIVVFIMAMEAISVDKLYFTKDWVPGAYGFDPLGLGKSGGDRMKTAEIKNGRLAMIAIGGMIHQALLTNMGVIEQLKSGAFSPSRYPLN